ncbi:MAG: helix-turn-helix domain-containing protein [Candidatus Nitrosotenuis sp.]
MYALNGKSEKILGLLKKCCLAEYESKAYFTLLLTKRSKVWDLSKKSSAPSGRVYVPVESLREKGLVRTAGEFPKVVLPEPFASYLSRKINEKQMEILQLIEAGNEIRETVYCLKPVAVRYRDKYRVFEPKHRRKLNLDTIQTQCFRFR